MDNEITSAPVQPTNFANLDKFQEDWQRQQEEQAQEEALAETQKQEALTAAGVTPQDIAQQEDSQRMIDNLADWDPRKKPGSEWGIDAHLLDLFAAFGGAGADTIGSTLTFGERILDAMSGEMYRDPETGRLMSRSTGEIYDADTDDFLGIDDANPLGAVGWGGKLGQGVIHFGLEAALLFGTGGASAATKVGKGAQALTGFSRLKAFPGIVPWAVKAAPGGKRALDGWRTVKGVNANTWYMKLSEFAFGGVGVDAVSKYSWDRNIGDVMGDVVPGTQDFFDNLPTTTDTGENLDDPFNLYLKNIYEQMGLGAAFALLPGAASLVRNGRRLSRDAEVRDILRNINLKDVDPSVAIKEALLSAGSPRVKESLESLDRVIGNIDNTFKSVRYQSAEMANLQKANPDFGVYKTSPRLEGPNQALPTSLTRIDDSISALNRIRRAFPGTKGSAGSITRPALLRTVRDKNDVALLNVIKQYTSSGTYKRELDAIQRGIRTGPEAKSFSDSIRLMQELSLGREAADLTPDQWLAPFLRNAEQFIPGDDSIKLLSQEHIRAADLLASSLALELRDSGVAAREWIGKSNLGLKDGPIDSIADKFIALQTEVARTKLLTSAEGQKLLRTDPGAFNANLDETVKEIVSGFDELIDFGKTRSLNDDVFRGLIEAISLSDDLRNLTDLENYIRLSNKGGLFKGKKLNPVWMDGLSTTMINSILSGPKTSFRAAMGTGSATFLRPMSTALGAALNGDPRTVKAQLAAMNGMIQAIPEAWTVFHRRLGAYWSGELSTVKTRFSQTSRADLDWNLKREVFYNSKDITPGERAAFIAADQIRAINDAKFLNLGNIFSYQTKVLSSVDDAFTVILGRAKARERAFLKATDGIPSNLIEINPSVIRKYETEFQREIWDVNGNLRTDSEIGQSIAGAKKEVTLTQDLTGFAARLDTAMNASPWTKPFFLFARTGINGINLTAKHTPLFNRLVAENQAILKATVDDLSQVTKYGITTPQELVNAQALSKGRVVMGGSIIGMAAMHFMNGGLTGNGPADRSKKQVWLDAGWKPRSIKIGNVWVGYEAFEPFNQILASIGDIGDYSQLMGDEWTENELQKAALVVAQGLTSKTYLASMQQFTELFTGQAGSTERIVANLMNNTVPLAGLRNELGKVITPYQRELNSGIWDSIRNRNLWAAGLPGGDLPIKYDMLTGQPIKDHDFPTRMFNMFSPVQFNLDYSAGRRLLFDSGYDLRTTTYTAPDGTNLKDYPELRSRFQQYIGEQNIEEELNILARNPRVLNSIATMQRDIDEGNRSLDPNKSYVHLTLIRNLFKTAKNRAWARMRQEEDVKTLIEEAQQRAREQRLRYRETQYGELLNIPK